MGFRYGAVCGLYRTGGLPDHEDEAQEYLVADELRRCRRYEFRNTGDFIQRTEVEKDATGVLSAPGHYHPGVVRPCDCRRQEEQAEEVRGTTGASFTVERDISTGGWNGNYSTQEFMSEDMIQQIAAVDGIEGYDATLITLPDIFN